MKFGADLIFIVGVMIPTFIYDFTQYTGSQVATDDLICIRVIENLIDSKKSRRNYHSMIYSMDKWK